MVLSQVRGKRTSIAAALAATAFFALMAYCLVSVLAGPAGFGAYAALGQRNAEMAANLGRLKNINQELSVELDALKNDSSRGIREARDLGYLYPAEGFIVLGGPTDTTSSQNSGKVVEAISPSTFSDLLIKEIALCVAVLTLFFFLLSFRGRRSPGIPRSRVAA